MNIWAWVYDKQEQLRQRGHTRLATIIDDLPTAVCDMRHEQAEAMVPEGLALARDLEEPWVEIFLRHWLMQSRVLHRYQGRDNLEGCVSLLEFSHRPGNRECPQSMCVVQDFANCYGVTDGPGYATERLAVTEEALGRIDPSWPCFECISLEKAGALRDAGRLEDAVAFIDGQLAAATAADVVRSHDKMFKNKAACLVKLGRGEEALTLLHAAPPSRASGESGQVDYKISMAEALCAVGHFDEAKRTLPPLEDIDGADGSDWLDVVERLVDAEARTNDDALGRQAARVVQRFETNGALWSTAETSLMAARLAASRGRRVLASAHLLLAEAIRSELKAPERLAEDYRRTAERVRALPYAPLPADIDAPDELTEDRIPNGAAEALETIGSARERWPDDERLAVLHGRLLAHLGLVSGARAVLETFVDGQPSAREAVRTLGLVLRDAGQHDAVEALVRDAFAADDPVGRWLLATSHERAGRLALAVDGFRAVLSLDPESDPARTRLCEIALREHRWADALALADDLVSRHEPGPHDWDRIVAATALGHWGIVRASAARLGIDVEQSDEPIDEDWGGMRLRTSGQLQFWATRTGPVTARIESITADRTDRERQDDVVLFDPAPVDREESDERTVTTYRELHVLAQGRRRSFTIDAVHPGDDALRELVDGLEAFDLRLQRRSGDGYALTPTDTNETVPGVYLSASVHEDADLEALHQQLLAAVGSWPGAAVWLELCQALVAERGPAYTDELERQRDVAERHGM